MRYLPHTDTDRQAMLKTIGINKMTDLFADIPAAFHLPLGSLNIPEALSEVGISRKFNQAASKNEHVLNNACFLGGGTYNHFVPAVVDYIISRGEFLTAYTPYQPEIAQGTLQALFEFQTMVARLTGMDVSNASMYEAATATAEAALMARRVTRRKNVVIAGSVNPRYRAVTDNYLSRLDGSYQQVSMGKFGTDLDKVIAALDGETACVIVQYPDFYGSVYDLAPLRAACDAHGCLMVVAFSDISAFGLITPPGEYGADIVVGSGQALGIPMAYGGPHLGIFTCKQKYLRQMPGRVCGLTEDADGKRGFVLTLSTREQHIRRDKATSNICTNQGLMCTAAATYMTLMGDAGLETIARRSSAGLQALVSQLPSHVKAADGVHYNETVLSFASQQARDAVLAAARERNIFAGIPLERMEKGVEPLHLLVATTEMIEMDDINSLLAVMEVAA
ncbi:MAG: glycine dehydrogenase (aminomethyl-transferring) [Zetaproteobacteria bacterium CG2_30_46_52]|nr:MAG: glycine dehydrogenase (aminomethyl-transferring) [Zetaproteobacteria bacterium CG2_30_46_52]